MLPRPLRVGTHHVFISFSNYWKWRLIKEIIFQGNCHIYYYQKSVLLFYVCFLTTEGYSSNSTSGYCFSFRAEAGLPSSPGRELHVWEHSSHQPPAGWASGSPTETTLAWVRGLRSWPETSVYFNPLMSRTMPQKTLQISFQWNTTAADI